MSNSSREEVWKLGGIRKIASDKYKCVWECLHITHMFAEQHIARYKWNRRSMKMSVRHGDGGQVSTHSVTKTLQGLCSGYLAILNISTYVLGRMSLFLVDNVFLISAYWF